MHCIHCRSEIDPKFKACPHCGEPVTDFLRRYAEAPIDGKYQILSRLGVGGMGEVYKVLHVHLNAIRVIKLMRSNIASDPAAHERFLREARLATRIHHPNVAALFDFSTLEDGSRYMVWEYIEGINLHELLGERGPLSPRYAARLAIQALQGLDAIHRAGIIHRDVSPENLMVTRDDEGAEQVKIIDLGIAKQGSGDDDNKTKTGMFVGKWKYCSPEHLGMLEAGERIDGRADLYSFGIVLYEMLTGVPPFQADTPHGYLMQHASETPKGLREVNPTVTASPELEALIFRALSKDRKQRFATAREFAQALEKLLPQLADDAGTAATLPAAVEVTAEPTRFASKAPAAPNANDVATVAAAKPKTEDFRTRAIDRELTERDEAPTPPARPTAPRAKRRQGAAAAVIAVVITIAVTGGTMLRKDDRQPTPSPVVAKPAKASVIVTPPTGHLGINAFPWAEVTSIRNVDSGEEVKLAAPLVTPAPLDLAPGRYEITLSNPTARKAITRTVEVRSGEDELLNVQFREPSELPAFGASR